MLFDLLYWSNLDLRYCLNVTHVEKKMCENAIETFLNTQGKTKDGMNSHLNTEKMVIQQ